jgi:hypothetical protein
MPTTEGPEYMKQLNSSLREGSISLQSWFGTVTGLTNFGTYSNPIKLVLKESGPSTDSGHQ